MRGPRALGVAIGVAVGVGLLAVAPTADAFDIETPGPESKDLRLVVRSPFDAIPGSGYLPVQVELTNDGPAPRRVSLEGNGETMYVGDHVNRRVDRVVEVPGRSRRRFDLLIPVPTVLDDHGAWRTVEIAVRGGGLGARRGSMSGRAPFHNRKPRPTVGFGPLLPDADTVLAGAVVGELHPVNVDFDLLGPDPRGLLGLDALWLTPTAIVEMPEPARQAIRGYVGQGGRVVAVDVGAEPPTALARLLPEAAWREGRYGLGQVHVVSEGMTASSELAEQRAETMGSLAARVVASDIEPRVQGLRTQGSLQLAAPEVPLYAGRIAAFLCAFVLLVGPVNLLVFAPRSRRTRLLWTTPAISVGASLVLAGGILLQDGVGGEGTRHTLRVLQPGSTLEHRFQVQVSRTGLVPFGGFSLEPDVHAEPVPPLGKDAQDLARRGAQASGDWFPTRAVQAYLLQRTKPSRQRVRVEVDAEGTPTLTSELAQPLGTIHHRDAQGRFWRAEGVAPGAQVTLTPVDAPAVALDWLHERARAFPGHIQRAVDRAAYAPGVVIAEAEVAEAWATHASLRWTDAPGLVLVEGTP